MTPDRRTTNPSVRPPPKNGRGAGRRSPPFNTPSELEALSAASARYSRSTGMNRPLRHVSPWPLALVAALVVAGALIIATPFEHLCTATIHYTGNDPAEQLPQFRRGLLDFAWQQTPATSGPQHPVPTWYVDSPGDRLLRLCLSTPNRQEGIMRVGQVAEGYLTYAEAERARTLASPSAGEQILSEHAARLESRLDEAQGLLRKSVESLPGENPQDERALLLSRWEQLRTDFESVRDELAAATSRLEKLRAEPEPTHGIVPAEDRRAALEADLGLQQDLRELQVFLAELKAELVKTCRKSDTPLEQLVVAAGQLEETVSSESGPDERMQETVHGLADEARAYGRSLAAFVDAWRKDLAALGQVSADPVSDELMTFHQRARARLNDFLFGAGKRLSAMRKLVQTISEGPGDDARFHVLQSKLVRSFRVAQSAHHRFEFAAGAIEGRDNYQLDSALRGVQGLRRRSQQQIRLIDEHLQKEASRRAKEERVRDLARAEQDVARLRSFADQTVASLVVLQGELNVSAGLTEEFLQASLDSEIARQRVETTREYLRGTRTELAELAARRSATEHAVPLELVECQVLASAVSLSRRLRGAAIVAIVTFLVVGLGGKWLTIRTNAGV